MVSFLLALAIVSAPARTVDMVVVNLTGQTLILEPTCDGFLYGEPQVVPHGEAVKWTWRRGETAITDGRRIWGPRLRAVRRGNEVIVVLYGGQGE